MNTWEALFSSGDFMPHGYCYMWNRGLVALHMLSDALIFLSYLSISLTLLYFVRKRRDLPFTWMFVAFGVFIVACGFTHGMEVWTLWHATYWLSGVVKAVTALASVPTAVLLIWVMPTALKIPAPEELQNEIAERQAVNAGLKRQADELSQQAELLELAHDGIFVRDMNSVITFWNHGAEENYGFSKAEALGHSSHELLKTNFSLPLAEIEKQVITVDRWDGELIHTTRDGRSITVESRWALVRDQAGRPKAVLEINHDVTAIRQLNQQLADRTTQLEATNKELEAFSYSVSHDLRAPLRAIDGFSQVLVEECGDKLDEPGRNCLLRVQAATRRMSELIDGLLGLARLARQEIRRESVDLSALATSVVQNLLQNEPDRKVDFDIVEDARAEGDRRLLAVALQNLLGNAWKFTGGQPCARIEFGKREENGRPVFFVRDNGAGFDMAYAGNLFGPFQRLHAQGEFEGHGIGLATVQRVIRRHGGHIWAEGAVGKGATFSFTL